MKGSIQCVPDLVVMPTHDAAEDDTWVIVASDGLLENEVRGGGGGLENQEIVDLCLKSKESTSARQLAREMVEAAQEAGTTDDVSVVLLRLAL